MWYSFDVYRKIDDNKSKKVGYHKYSTFQQALDAKRAIENFKKGKYLLQPRENALFKFVELGGWTCGKITTES